MKGWILIITTLSFLPGRILAQEDSIRLKKESLKHEFISDTPDFIPYSVDFKEPKFQSPSLFPEVVKIDMKFDKPLFIPPYYTNPSPIFRGDYSTGGKILPHLYGSGFQKSLPGIGIMNNASLMFQYDLNRYFEFRGGLNVTKYNFPFSAGQVFNPSGILIYHPNNRLRFTVFGSYVPTYQYDLHKKSYGATVGYDFSERFGMEVGVERSYDPMRRQWETVPIVVPYYKFDKFELGIDVGGILYEILRNVIYDKRKSGLPVMLPSGR